MLRPYVRGHLDAEQLCGAALREWLEPPPGPEARALGQLVHQPVSEPELAGQGLDVRVGGEKAIGAALHDEAVATLGDDDAAQAPLAFQHGHLDAGPRQLPRRRQAGEARPDHGDRQTQPRSAAVVRAICASAATSDGSSLRESVRSSWMPSRSAIARYAMSTSRSEEHTSELQSLAYLVCRLLLE